MPLEVGPQAATAWSCVTAAEKSGSDCTGCDLCLCAVALLEPSMIPVAGLGWVLLQGFGGLMDLSPICGPNLLLCAPWCIPYCSCYLEFAVAGCLLGEILLSFVTLAINYTVYCSM